MRRRIYFDAMRRGEDTPPYAFLGKAVLKRAGGVEPRPYGQLGGWYGGTAGRCRHRPLRRGLQGGRCKDVSPSHGFAVPAPFRQGGQEDGGRIATGALRPRNDRSRKNLRVIPRPVRRLVVGIRNTPTQRSRRTDCHDQCAHWLRNDTVNKRCCISPGGPM